MSPLIKTTLRTLVDRQTAWLIGLTLVFAILGLAVFYMLQPFTPRGVAVTAAFCSLLLGHVFAIVVRFRLWMTAKPTKVDFQSAGNDFGAIIFGTLLATYLTLVLCDVLLW